MSNSLHQIIQKAIAWDNENPVSESESEPDSDEEKFRNVYDYGVFDPEEGKGGPRKLEIQLKRRKITAKILLPKLISQELSIADFKKVVGDMDKDAAFEVMSKMTTLTIKSLKSEYRRVECLAKEIEKAESNSRGKLLRMLECDVEEEILEAKIEEIDEELRETKSFIKEHSKILKKRQKKRDAEKQRNRPYLPYYIPYPSDVMAASGPLLPKN